MNQGIVMVTNQNKSFTLKQIPKRNLKSLSVTNILMTVNILFLTITLSIGWIAFYTCIAILLTTLIGLSLNIFCIKSLRKKDIWEKTEV